MKTYEVVFSAEGRNIALIITANNISKDADNQTLYADTAMIELPGPIIAINEVNNE